MAHKRFELTIYNEIVKKSVLEGDPNKTGLSDDWADTRYVEVTADSDEQARRKLHHRYPESKGFVITECRLVND
jgi:hypothetical protein